MASLICRPGGLFEIQLRVGPARQTIRLGRASRRMAESVKVKIEALALARELGVEPDLEVLVWLDRTAGAKLRKRITKASLAPEDARSYDVGLRAFADAFLADYTAGNAGTKETIRMAFNRLVKHLGADRLMRSITVKQAEAARAAMVAGGMAEATAATTIKKARQLWAEALTRGMVASNVWLDVTAGRMDNEDNSFYVATEMVERVLAQCPTVESRLIVALSRYGGLRCPSEHLRLRRDDIDWARSRFRVRGKGKKDRTVPIFPHLRPYLEAAEAAARPGSVHLIEKRRELSKTAWRRSMMQWVASAGLTPWPRLTHNLRASCETDLVAAGHALHVVGRWLGHSESIARRHYLQPREEDFEKAAAGPAERAAG